MTSTINLDQITLEDGTEITSPPVITDAEGKIVDNEATEALQAQIKAWAEVAHGIVDNGELADNGELTPEDSKALRNAYAELPPVPGKSFARGYAEEQTRNALSDTTDAEAAFRVAQMWSKISKDQKQDAPKARVQRAAKPKVTPTELAVDKLAMLKLAVSWFEANPDAVVGDADDAPVEDNFAEQADDKVEDLNEMLEAYIEWLEMEVEEGEDKPEFEESFGDPVDPIVRDAAKLALQKARRARSSRSGSPHTGPRRNIGKHIEEAFGQVEVGTFLTVSEIVNLKSEEYGDDKPSSGAVANRLFPPSGSACTIENLEPGHNEDGKQGATKIA